ADSRFTGALAKLMGDASQMVRKRAFAALGNIAAKARAANAPPAVEAAANPPATGDGQAAEVPPPLDSSPPFAL
ncbi:MAG TPA: hypothetical protein VMU19_03540, partial [Bryobacteraceae bacterium]|nr:hypothetical protein [Bryobacteraceae bacterium]